MFDGVSSLRRVGSKAPALPILKKDNHCEAGASLLSPTEAGASAEHNRSLPWWRQRKDAVVTMGKLGGDFVNS
ncbi:hypothetical protein [Parabacteroides sp. Marseille-P3160]|uniref:hypothetical protein n=1 Tax=Parabacteroides sp. Marseille-P3160 TaxID=1917887 RepID=UPI001117F8C2|nr:hypothetical protein [Parabacteroides sp. Marseille-P3160]